MLIDESKAITQYNLLIDNIGYVINVINSSDFEIEPEQGISDEDLIRETISPL